MAVKRIVSTSFWSDSKVDTFSPEDKYFMLYLLTNPHTTQLGIYEFSMKHAAFEMGYSVETVQALLSRFQDRYRIIMYCQDTGEIAIKNYLKHSIVKGGKPVLDCLKKELRQVKSKDLVKFVFSANQNSENATVREFISYMKERCKYDLNDNDNDNDNERIVDESSYNASGKKKFIPPTLDEVAAYCNERHNGISPSMFIDYYEARGWKYGTGKPMVNWKAAVRTWEQKEKGPAHTQVEQRKKATEEVNARIFEELFGGEPT